MIEILINGNLSDIEPYIDSLGVNYGVNHARRSIYVHSNDINEVCEALDVAEATGDIWSYGIMY